MSDSDNISSFAVPQTGAIRWDLVGLAALLTGYLLVVAIGYGLRYDFVCRDVMPVVLCQALGLAVPRALSVAALFGLLLLTRPEIRATHRRLFRSKLHLGWCVGFAVGLGVTLVPLGFSAVSGVAAPAGWAGFSWLAGLTLAGVSGLAGLYAVGRVQRVDRRAFALVGATSVLAIILPDLVLLLQPLWRNETLTDLTFLAVVGLLDLMGHAAMSEPASKVIGLDDFVIAVGPQCSGVEGFALISAFLTVYLLLFRDHLRLGRAVLLLPVGILLSWTLNVVRITVLILIGRYVSPELAVDGFHSHAGWLAFLSLALALALTAHAVPWFRRAVAVEEGSETPVRAAKPPVFADYSVVMILPFAVFMASATITAAIAEVPGVLYPARALAVATVLALGWRVLAGLNWRPTVLPLVSGALCGVLWVATAPVADLSDTLLSQSLAALPFGLLVLWIVARILGTAVLVPIVDELFFRGYVQPRVASALGDGMPAKLIAIAAAAVLFALLHDRWLAAGLAGVLFGLLALRRGILADAIWAHAAANAVIAAAAAAKGAWHLI